MPHPPEKIVSLAQKLLQGNITPAEKAELDAWYDAQIPDRLPWSSDLSESELKNRLFEAVSREGLTGAKTVPMRRKIPWGRVAAAMLLIAGTAVYVWRPSPTVTRPRLAEQRPAAVEIKPGGNKAVLTLGDGSNIILDHSANGRLAQQGGTLVSKSKDGELLYQTSDVSDLSHVQLNTLTTPRGGQYRLQLPDGSVVWLNAASSIKFPAAFKRNERHVQLTGEAYFEIAKDKARPFRVQLANNTRVEVLGTHFNVMAYPDEQSSSTTLLEGAVQIAHNNATRRIRPGEQAVVKDEIRVSAVNAEEAIAWQRGDFQFGNTDFAGILRQLERWYSVEFVYEQLPHLTLKGIVSRSYNLSQVLKMIELTSGVRFKTEGHVVKVLGPA